MNRQPNDPNNRMRTILQRMERSIDDARSKRVEGISADTSFGSRVTAPASTGAVSTPRSMDPLDTRIADSVPAKPGNDSPATVRDAETMFDFKGPRLKARPKRPSND
ncbi:MAG: hypothetical protein P8J59_06655 [Phycisphaerales bacterium]|jgi:hypothetical protein|nr:hypothetical protein [Phycisphaerales bacterium]